MAVYNKDTKEERGHNKEEYTSGWTRERVYQEGDGKESIPRGGRRG